MGAARLASDARRRTTSGPPDFDRFWIRTLQNLAMIEPAVERRSTQRRGELQLERLTFRSLGDATIHAYLLRWQDEAERPLIVHGHGYRGRATVRWAWAAGGANVAGVDIRGWGRSAGAVPRRSRHGYMLTGIESPDTHVLRGAVCDLVRAVQVAMSLTGNRSPIIEGTSFSGGLALMAEALIQVACLLVVAVPTFGWTEGRHFLVRAGSSHEINSYLDRHPEQAEDIMLVLRYFDPVHFAGRVRCPTLVGIGRRDEVVPASTVRAIVDRIAGPHEILEFPVSHSSEPEEALWEDFEARWLRLAAHGVPPGFGQPAARPA